MGELGGEVTTGNKGDSTVVQDGSSCTGFKTDRIGGLHPL